MKNMCLSLILLLSVGNSMVAMERKNSDWVFNGLSSEELEAFDNDLYNGSFSAEIMDQYRELEKKLALGNQAIEKEFEMTKDMLHMVGWSKFVNRKKKAESVKIPHREEKRNGFEGRNGNSSTTSKRALNYLSSSRSNKRLKASSQVFLFVNYSAKELEKLSLSSSSSSDSSE